MAENSVLVSSSQFSSAIDESKFDSTSLTKTSGERWNERLEEFYDVEKCVRCIKCRRFTKVALQFPDSQLCDAPKVAQAIEEQANCKTYILADTSYGSCCVDEVAAEHAKADLIIHFGSACLSLTERIPVLYVFGKAPINITSCCQSFRSFFPDKDGRILLIYDVVYDHAIGEIFSNLSSDYKYIVRAFLNYPDSEQFICLRDDGNTDEENVRTSAQCKSGYSNGVAASGTCDSSHCCQTSMANRELQQLCITNETEADKRYCRFGRTFTLADGFSVEDYTMFYIGKESLTLTNHMMTYNKCQFYSYNPESDLCRKEALNVNRMLMKRYYLIEKAKDSRVVGILVGTLGVAKYLSAITRIKKVLRQAGKKFYTFVVGKLSAEKLANFMEIDVFVLIACPENSLINSQDFYAPIVTPFEIEIACTSGRQWTGQYITDFRELLSGAPHYVDVDNKAVREVPDISLISGQVRPSSSSSTQDDGSECSTLVIRNQNTTLSTQHHTTSGEFLAQRSWKGLEPNKELSKVSHAVEGRTGIASEYTHEPNVDNSASKDR